MNATTLFMERIANDCKTGNHVFENWVSTGEDSGRRDYVKSAEIDFVPTKGCIFCNKKHQL